MSTCLTRLNELLWYDHWTHHSFNVPVYGKTALLMRQLSSHQHHCGAILVVDNTIQYNTIQCSLFWEGRYMINPVKSFLTHHPQAGLSLSKPARPSLNERLGKVLVLHKVISLWLVSSNLPTVSFQLVPFPTSPAHWGPETLGGYHFSEPSFNLCKYIILLGFPAIRLISWTPFYCTTIHASNWKFPLAGG